MEHRSGAGQAVYRADDGPRVADEPAQAQGGAAADAEGAMHAAQAEEVVDPRVAIRLMNGKEVANLPLGDNGHLAKEVKLSIQEKLGHPPFAQRLVHGLAELADNEDLARLPPPLHLNLVISEYDRVKALLIAVQSGHEEAVAALLSREADACSVLLSKHEAGRTLLHQAAFLGSGRCRAVVEALLEALLEADVPKEAKWRVLSAKDSKGCTALHLAAQQGQSDFVQTIMSLAMPVKERRALLTMLDKDGYSVLHTAARTGNADMVELFLAGDLPTEDRIGIATCAGRYQRTWLHEAATSQEEQAQDVVEALLRAEIPPQAWLMLAQARDAKEDTALRLAARAGHADIVELLLKVDLPRKKDRIAILQSIEKEGTHLHAAVSCGSPLDPLRKHRAVVRALLKAEVPPGETWKLLCAKDSEKDYNTALHLAVRSGQVEVVEAMMQPDMQVEQRMSLLTMQSRKANTNERGWIEHRTVLHEMFDPRYAKKKDNLVAKALTAGLPAEARRSCLHLKDAEGDTVLHLASRTGRTDVAKVLLQDMEVEDRIALLTIHGPKGRTALHEMFDQRYAQGNDNVLQMAALLTGSLPAEARSTLLRLQDDDGDTVLHLAFRAGHADVAQYLLSLADATEERIAVVSALNKNRRTLLHEAANQERKDVLEVLLAQELPAEGWMKLRSAKDSAGHTVMDLAKKHERSTVIERLMVHLGQ